MAGELAVADEHDAQLHVLDAPAGLHQAELPGPPLHLGPELLHLLANDVASARRIQATVLELAHLGVAGGGREGGEGGH